MMSKRNSFSCLLWCLSLSFLETYHAWTTTTTTRARTAISFRHTVSSSSALCVTHLPTQPALEFRQADGNDPKEIIKTVQAGANGTDANLQSELSPLPQSLPDGVAIILNTNARGVTPDLVDAIQTQFDFSAANKARVFVTSTSEQARQAVEELQKQPARIVIPIGGDGTLTTMIQYFYDVSPMLPLFGYIPMGTGNALGTVIGCSPRRRFRRSKKMQAIRDVLDKLLDIAESMESDSTAQPQVDIVDIPLLQITMTSSEQRREQVCCFFAGIGFDSLMLQDYKDLQEWSSRSALWKNKFESVWGYTVALFTRTLPKCIADQSHIVTVELSTTKPTLWVDHRRGDVVRSITPETTEKKTLLYRGKAGIVAAATTPFYGGNLKLFPFARVTENGCQVRVGRIHPIQGVLNMFQIFQGTYRNSDMGCLDFIGTQFSLEVQDEQGYPVQHSGESMGYSQHVELEVLKDQVKFVTLLPPRLVCEDGSCN
jgi:diacylglycerol kinase family enzyme